MSGPKLIELRQMQAARERQRNHDRCATFGAEYARLVRELAVWEKRLAELGLPGSASLRSTEQVGADVENLLRQGSHHEAARIFGEEVNRARRAVQNRQEAFQERLVTLQNRQRQVRRASELLTWERDRWVEQMTAGIPGGWPEAEQSQLHILARQLLEKVITPAPPPAPVNLETIAQLEKAETQVKEAQQALETGNQEFTRRRNDTQTRLLEHVSAVAAPAVSLAAVLQRFAQPPAAPDDRTLIEIEKLLVELASWDEEIFVREIREKSETIRAEREVSQRKFQAEALLLECVARRQARQQLLGWREQVRQLIDLAAPVLETLSAAGTGVAAVVEELQTLLTANVVVDLEPIQRRLQSAIKSAEAGREREQRRKALLDALQSLGYETNENLATALVEGGRLVWRRPAEDEYAVEVVVNPALSQVQTVLVRYAASEALTEQQKRRDYEQEEAWCADHAKLRAKMAERGWETPWKLQIKPGEHPVKTIVDKTKGEARSRPETAPQTLRKM